MTETRRHLRRLTGWAAVVVVLFGAGTAWYLLDPGFRAGGEAPATAGRMPKDAFEQRVRSYLLANPEVIIAALETLETRRQEAEASEAEAVLKNRAEEVYRDPESPVGGNPQGDVTLVEFFDYNCPYCRQVAPVMADAESADPDLRIVLGPGSDSRRRRASPPTVKAAMSPSTRR